VSFSGVDAKIILKWVFGNWDIRAYTGLICLSIVIVGGHL
jgi:hypothetical protein